MDSSNSPSRFTQRWAYQAGGAYVRTVPETPSGEAGAASVSNGFPPENFQAIAAGGVPPFGQDFNGLVGRLTGNLRWWAAGGFFPFDQTFANAIGGYPRGAVVMSGVNGQYWVNMADNNTTNPDASNAQNWQNILQPEIAQRVAAVAAEASARAQADQTEATTRNNQDTALSQAISNEASTRNTNDTNILNFAATAGRRRQVINTGGNWSFTFPSDVKSFLATITGGGGAGMGCQASIGVMFGAGAGAGETLELGLTLGNGGQTVTGTVGPGASGTVGATTGSAGGATTLICNGTTYTARGGIAPVLSGSNGAYFAGGGQMTASTNGGIPGGDGSDGQAGTVGGFGHGGAPFGGGFRRAAACNPQSTTVAAAIIPGGGGPGAYDPYNTANQYRGGDGAAGRVVLIY